MFPKTARIALCVVLAVSAMSQQKSNNAKGEVIKDQGCVRAGVESGCLGLRTFDDKTAYTLLFSDGNKPELGAAISFEGTKHDGPTTCMQGVAVDVKSWVRLKRVCPKEAANVSAMATQPPDTSCTGECRQRYNDKIKICDAGFNSTGSAHYHNTRWHSDCLASAKSEFDSCLSTCK